MRHQIATEMWEALNRFHLEVQRPDAGAARRPQGAESGHTLLPLGRRVQPAAAGHHRLDDAARGGLVLPAGGQVPGARGEDGARARRQLPPAGRRGRRASAHATALALAAAADLQPWARCCARSRPTSPTTASERRASSRSAVIELLTLSPVLPRSIRFSVGEVDAALAHITERGARPTTAPSRCPDRRRRARRGARSAACTPSFAYQRLDDLLRPRPAPRAARACSGAATGSATASRTSSSPTARSPRRR